MFGWFKSKPPPLEGTPARRRQKTFQSSTGYVYQYYFDGSRRANNEFGAGFEYVFSVTADRKKEFPVSIHVADNAISAWELRAARQMLSKERYAVAKMALFEAFNERPNPAALGTPVLAGTESVARFLAILGRD